MASRFEQAVVYGAGAVGSYLGARLPLPTTLVGRAEHMQAVATKGLRITGREDETVHLATVETCPDLAPRTVVLVGVKLYDLAAAATDLAPRLGDDTVVVALANGLEPDGILSRALGRSVARIIVQLGVTLEAPGQVASWGGSLLLGPGEVEEELADLFAAGGLAIERCDDLLMTSWRKFTLNCVVNPLSLITGLRNRDLITPELAETRQAVVAEITALAAAKGIELPADLAEDIDRVMSRSRNRTSMLQDGRRGKPTEIEFLNGWVVREAEKHGLDVPVNRSLTEQVRALTGQ